MHLTPSFKKTVGNDTALTNEPSPIISNLNPVMKTKYCASIRHLGLASFALCALAPLAPVSATTFLHESFVTKSSGEQRKTLGEYRLNNGMTADANKDVAGGDIIGFSAANVWGGNSANPRTIETGLNSSSIRSTGGSVEFRGANDTTNRFVYRTVDSYTSGPSLFVSASLNTNVISPNAVSLVAFTDTATDFRANAILNNNGGFYNGLGFGFVGNGTGMDLVVRYRDGNLNYTDYVLLDNISVDTTYTIIARIDWNAAPNDRDPFTIWVNPESATEPSGGISLLGYLGNPENITAVHLLQRSLGTSLLDAVLMDELRMANTYQDLGAIPEPSTTAGIIGGVALALLLGRGVRRRG